MLSSHVKTDFYTFYYVLLYHYFIKETRFLTVILKCHSIYSSVYR